MPRDLACRLIVTLPVEEGGPDVDAVYEDLGEMDSGSFAGVKALYSDARKRAAVASGIGAYLYTSLEAVVLPIGPHARQVQAIRRQGKSDLLVLSPETEQWPRHGYQTRMSTEAVRRDLGEILAHGEPENGIGQGEVADQAAQRTPEAARRRASHAGEERGTARSSPSTSATSDRRPRDEPPTAHPRTGGHRRNRRPDPWSAAQLAARIQIPRRLPPRYDGQPLQHLSHSSYSRFVLCPEDWRRRYVLGEKSAPTGSMFLGRRVDDAITLYYRHLLDHGERLSVDQIKDAFWDAWKAAGEAEREQLGITWEADLREDSAFKLGLDAVELTFRELIPQLGEPVAVQRKVEYTIAPGVEWSVLCYLDLETRRPTAGSCCQRSSTTRSRPRC